MRWYQGNATSPRIRIMRNIWYHQLQLDHPPAHTAIENMLNGRYLPLCPALTGNTGSRPKQRAAPSAPNVSNRSLKAYAISPRSKVDTAVAQKDAVGTSRILAKMLSACVGSIMTTMVVTPLDVVKIRLQAVAESSSIVVRAGVDPAVCKTCSHYTFSNGLMEHVVHKSYSSQFSSEALKKSLNPNSSIFTVMNKIVRTEGVTALWDGLAPTLLMAIPNTMIYMVLYDEFCHRILPSYNFSPTFSAIFSGGVARIISGTIVAPFELIRTQMQSSAADASEGIGKKFTKIVRQGGFTSLWRGLSPTLWRDVPFSALYWLLYEKIKIISLENSTKNQSVFFLSFISGATAGSIAAFLTTPFDVIKTRRQIDIYSSGEHMSLAGVKECCKFVNSKELSGRGSPATSVARGTLQVIRSIIKEEGFRRLFTGVAPRVGKVAPACAIMISSYEVGKWYFGVEM